VRKYHAVRFAPFFLEYHDIGISFIDSLFDDFFDSEVATGPIFECWECEPQLFKKLKQSTLWSSICGAHYFWGSISIEVGIKFINFSLAGNVAVIRVVGQRFISYPHHLNRLRLTFWRCLLSVLLPCLLISQRFDLLVHSRRHSPPQYDLLPFVLVFNFSCLSFKFLRSLRASLFLLLQHQLNPFV